MGQNPTDNEVHDMINEVDVDGSGVVEFDEFVQFIARLMKNSDPENEVRECYRRYSIKHIQTFQSQIDHYDIACTYFHDSIP